MDYFLPHFKACMKAHGNTEALRRFAERFQKQNSSPNEAFAQFSLDPDSGNINVSVFDSERGALKVKLTPDQALECLRRLEQTDDNDAPLASFFSDL